MEKIVKDFQIDASHVEEGLLLEGIVQALAVLCRLAKHLKKEKAVVTVKDLHGLSLHELHRLLRHDMGSVLLLFDRLMNVEGVIFLDSGNVFWCGEREEYDTLVKEADKIKINENTNQ